MKKKNISLKPLTFNKTTIASLNPANTDQVKGGGVSQLGTCDEFCANTRAACPFATRFIDCLTEIQTRCGRGC